jgi:enamine deaminase RidA (YjgF/YER057c/UK114 family)
VGHGAPRRLRAKKLRLDVPFRQGVKCGNTIYTSGQVALGENGEALHPTDIARQTRVATENINALLAEFGATTEDVMRKNTYYVGVSDFRQTCRSAPSTSRAASARRESAWMGSWCGTPDRDGGRGDGVGCPPCAAGV